MPKDNKKTPFDKKKRNRSYSHAAVNLADAIIYTTVGALCGLAAGMSFWYFVVIDDIFNIWGYYYW